MPKPRILFFLVALALLYTVAGMIPGRLLVTADIPRDLLAWKGDPAVRVRVSNTLLSDVVTQLIPWDVEARRLLAAGEMPWRNRFAADGEPLFANPLAGLLSPFTWPRLIAGLHGWAWTVLFKLLVAALSMYWFARVLGAGEGAAAISAAVFALSGFSIVWALYPHTNVFVLFPAMAASAVTLVREPSPKRVLIAAAIAALATAGGHPEALFVGVTAIFVFLLMLREWRRLPLFASAALAGFLIVGIQLVPFLVLLSRSYVVHSRTEHLGTRFRAEALIAQVMPGILGSPLRGELDLTGAINGAENFNQRAGAYVGALALLAILLGWRALPPPFRRAALLGGVVFVLGLAVPGVAQLLRLIPVVQWLAFEYCAVAAVLFLSVAVGPALFALDVRRRPGAIVVAIGLLLVIGGAAPAIAPGALERAARAGIAALQQRGSLPRSAEVYEQRLAYYLGAAKWTALRRAALPGLCFVVFGIALIKRRRELAAAALVGELIVFGLGYNPSIAIDEVAPEPGVITDIKRRDPDGRFFIGASHEVFTPNLATTFGVRDVHAYDILYGEREAHELASTGYDPRTWALPAEPTAEQARELAKRGVRYYLTPSALIEFPDAVPPPPARNDPPEGLILGALVSLAGVVLAGVTAFIARK